MAAEPAATDQRLNTENQHIRHIESSLLPAVLINGEGVKTATVVDAMRESAVTALSMAYIHEGRIEWTDAVGVRRIGGPPVDSDTVYQAASISKPVTAIAVMTLVQTGKLQLDRDIDDYLSSWKVPRGSATLRQRVTVRRLLSHSAGTTVHGFDGYASGEKIPSLLQVLEGEKPANSSPICVVTEPGSEWRYSGGGYVIVQQLLTDTMKLPFSKLMDTLVLKPIGMSRSSFDQPNAAALAQDAATPYDSAGHPIAGGAHTYPEQSAAGLWSTPSDLARLALNLQCSLSASCEGVLSTATARAMLQPEGAASWGMGFRVGGDGDHRYFLHGGWNAGFRSLLVAFEHGDGIAIMTNGDAGVAITSSLLRTVAAEYDWPEFQPKHRRMVALPAESLDRLVGRYRLYADETAVITRSQGTLFLRMPGSEPAEMTPESPASFFSKTSDLEATFQLGVAGPTGVKIFAGMNGGAAIYEASRIDAGPDPETAGSAALPPELPRELKRLIGHYSSAGDSLEISESEGILVADGVGLQRVPLRERDTTHFLTTGSDPVRLAFDLDRHQQTRSVLIGRRRFEPTDVGLELLKSIQAGVRANAEQLRKAALAAKPPAEPTPKRASDLVDLRVVDPTILLDIRYATSNNFIGFPLYEHAAAYLQRPAADALRQVQHALASEGYGLLIHDAYRPWFVTKMFWDASPESAHIFVADPSIGSRHNRGCAVDLTLYDLISGKAVEMPSRYDEMSPRSFADYRGGTSRQRALRDMLRRAMEAQGFVVYPQEWWHFDYQDWSDYAIGTAAFSQLELITPKARAH